MTLDSETVGKLWFLIYLVAGIPVAWWHIRQQRMTESVESIRFSQSRSMVVLTLATMWPILLLAMALTHLQRKPARQRNAPTESSERSADSQDQR